MACGYTPPAPELVDRLLFPSPRPTYTAESWPGELVWLPRNPFGTGGVSSGGEASECGATEVEGEDRVPALLLLAPLSRYFVLCLHGNGDDLGRFYMFCHRFRVCASVHVLAVEYPGYGICPGGQSTDVSVTQNAYLGFRFLTETLKWPVEQIIIFGRSVGCGPALEIASRYPIHGLALVSPFTSVSALVRGFLGRVADLIPERFPNKEKMKLVACKLLLVHGKRDSMVPMSHGLEMYDTCVGQKQIVTPESMGHNTNLHSDPSLFVIPFLSFFSVLPPTYHEVRIPAMIFEKPRKLAPEGLMSSCLTVPCCLKGVEGISTASYRPPICRLTSVLEGDGDVEACHRAPLSPTSPTSAASAAAAVAAGTASTAARQRSRPRLPEPVTTWGGLVEPRYDRGTGSAAARQGGRQAMTTLPRVGRSALEQEPWQVWSSDSDSEGESLPDRRAAAAVAAAAVAAAGGDGAGAGHGAGDVPDAEAVSGQLGVGEEEEPHELPPAPPPLSPGPAAAAAGSAAAAITAANVSDTGQSAAARGPAACAEPPQPAPVGEENSTTAPEGVHSGSGSVTACTREPSEDVCSSVGYGIREV